MIARALSSVAHANAQSGRLSQGSFSISLNSLERCQMNRRQWPQPTRLTDIGSFAGRVSANPLHSTQSLSFQRLGLFMPVVETNC